MQPLPQDQSVLERQQTVYSRSYLRNVPSQPLQPYLDARPMATKYCRLVPVLCPSPPPITVPLQQQATFHVNTIFNPGNDTAPWSGYATSVNTESILRNQVYALQKCDQAIYVPSSQSSMFVNNMHYARKDNHANDPFPLLFQDPVLSTSNPTFPSIGHALFHNATRTQLNDL